MLRFIGGLVVVVLVIGVIGWSLDWFSLDSGSASGGTEYRVVVDKEKIKHDAGKVADSVESLGDSAADGTEPDVAVGDAGVHGQVTSVSYSAESQEFEVETPTGAVSVVLAPDAKVTLNGEVASLSDLRVGDRVVVRVEESDALARRIASRVEATRA